MAGVILVSSGSDDTTGGLSAPVRRFAAKIIDSIVSLDIALFFQGNPSTVDTPSALSSRIYGASHDIDQALNHLVEVGVLTHTTLGAGAYALYSLTEDTDVRRLLDRLSDAFHRNPQARTEVVRGVVSGWADEEGAPAEA